MKSIKFQQDTPHDPFYKELQKQVGAYLAQNQFSGFATGLVWFKAVLYGGLYLALYLSLLFASLSFIGSLAVWALLGLTGILLGLNVGHDAAHDTLSPNKRLKDWIFRLSFGILGTNAYLWRLRHVQSHHLFPNVDDCDAGIDDNPFIRLSPNTPLHRRHRWQYLYAPLVYLLYSLHWVFVKDWVILKKKRLANLRDIRHPKLEVWRFFAGKLAYVAYLILLPLYCMNLEVWQVLAGFAALHFTQSYAFIFCLAPSHFVEETLFDTVDAEGNLGHSWADHQMAASLDYHATKKWTNFLFGGVNAHVAHHLFPNICHVHYPVISTMIAQLAFRHKLPYHHNTLPKAIASHFRFLKRMGEQPGKSVDEILGYVT